MNAPAVFYDIGKFTTKGLIFTLIYFDNFLIGSIINYKFEFNTKIKLETQENLIPLLLNYFEQCKNRRINELILEEKKINDLNDRINERIYRYKRDN